MEQEADQQQAGDQRKGREQQITGKPTKEDHEDHHAASPYARHEQHWTHADIQQGQQTFETRHFLAMHQPQGHIRPHKTLCPDHADDQPQGRQRDTDQQQDKHVSPPVVTYLHTNRP